MGHAHRPRTRRSPPRRYCRAAVRPGTPPAPHSHRSMPSLPLHLAPPVAPPTLAVRGLETNPPRAARPIHQQRPPPATTVRSSPGLSNPQRDTSRDAAAHPVQSPSWDANRSILVTKPLVTSSNPNTQTAPGRSPESCFRQQTHAIHRRAFAAKGLSHTTNGQPITICR